MRTQECFTEKAQKSLYSMPSQRISAVTLLVLAFVLFWFSVVDRVETPSSVVKSTTGIKKEIVIRGKHQHEATNNNNTTTLFPPLVMLTSSCSGSSFSIRFAKRLVQRHSGLDPFVIQGETFKILQSDATLPFKTEYNSSLAKTSKYLADRQMVRDVYNRISRNASQVMVPKVLSGNQFRPGIAAELFELDARFILTYRRNLLERRVCRIRDCFEKKTYRGHYPVFENGTKSDLCFDRRHYKNVKTLAFIDQADFDKEATNLVKAWGCQGAIESADLEYLLNQAILENGKKLTKHHPRLALEDLEAFEYSSEFSSEFNKSLEDWKALLLGWGIEPQQGIILDEMRLTGIGTRKHSSVLKNIYNKRQTKDVIFQWADNASYCDWRWMMKQRNNMDLETL